MIPIIQDRTPHQAAAPGEILSPSQVCTLMDCSYRWHAKYVLKLPEPPTSNQILGRAVHVALAANFEQKCDSKEDLPVLGVLALFREAWALLTNELEFRDEEDPDELRKQGEGLVLKYMEEAAPRIDPRAVELRVEGIIRGVKVAGYIDLVDVDGCVIEIKTAKARPHAIDPKRPGARERSDRYLGQNQIATACSAEFLRFRAGTQSDPYDLSESPRADPKRRSGSKPAIDALQPPSLRLLAAL